MIQPTRRTQPYRRGARLASPVLLTMLRGRPLYTPNPMDVFRTAQRRARISR